MQDPFLILLVSYWLKITNADIPDTKGHKWNVILTLCLTLNQKVTGSIPVWPTILKHVTVVFSAVFLFSVLARFSCLVCGRCAGT